MNDQKAGPMFYNNTTVKRALLSVSDKQNIVDFAKELHQLQIEIVSTGGTAQLLRQANIPVQEVSDITRFPEMMDGRVKTLHPQIHGAILGKRDEHHHIAMQHGIEWIDLVVVNLYPFLKTIQKPHVTWEEAIENIDIGGPSMIRSAAKNMHWVGVVVDSQDYGMVLQALKTRGGLPYEMRQQLATKAFAHTAQYDALIYHYLEQDRFPDIMNIALKKSVDLRYGENPHQKAFAYQFLEKNVGILSAMQHQGKQLSYNNIADADAAVACVREFKGPTCVIVKHANPCGAAMADNIELAFHHAFQADAQSAFGGIVAINQQCTKALAQEIVKHFIEVLVAPSYEAEALAILSSKANCRVLEWPSVSECSASLELKVIEGGVLVQERDSIMIHENDLKIVTHLVPSCEEIQSLLFAWRILKHIKSNAILIAKESVTMGVGAGQVSRVDAVHMAMRKAGQDLRGAVLASDAFFPFRDSIERIANTGIRAIIQPGGSIRDDEVIAACDEYGIAMVLTGKRCFKH